jgi:hypothetical protein
MKKLLLTITAVAALAALPTFASADPDAAGNAAAGAAVGAGVGFAVGGPMRRGRDRAPRERAGAKLRPRLAWQHRLRGN